LYSSYPNDFDIRIENGTPQLEKEKVMILRTYRSRVAVRSMLALLAISALSACAVDPKEGTPKAEDGKGRLMGGTALVITDPQNDFLSPKGVTWGVVGKSVVANDTVKHIDQLFAAAKGAGVPVFISPHYYYPTDHQGQMEGTLEKLMHKIKMFDRESALSINGFKDSGADWLNRYKKYIDDGKTVITSPHKVYGPETNDLVLQLRKRGVDKIILGGMSANLCVESHLRELLEQGFEVTVVKDATAAAVTPGLGDGYAAALINFGFIANGVVTTKEAVELLKAQK
jgi:nicotinamidase-related amidase